MPTEFGFSSSASGNEGSPVPPPLLPPPAKKSSGRSGYGRSRGWMIATFILGFLLLWRLPTPWSGREAVRSVGVRSGKVQEILIESQGSENKIAVIDITGVISAGGRGREDIGLVEWIKDQLSVAAKDPGVKAIVVRIDSPGGEVLASDEIYRQLKRFQDRQQIPVVATLGSLAASGGYYVASSCTWIVANELTITGSIGVIMHGYNYRGLLNKVGIRPRVFKSGKLKDMLSGDRIKEDELPEESAIVQALIDRTHHKFKQVIEGGRGEALVRNHGAGQALSVDWEEYTDGRIISGEQAHAFGFVDELGDFETAVARAMMLTDIESADLVQYQRPVSFANLFRFLGTAETPALHIDLGLEFPRLQSGKTYFLWLPQ